VHQSELLCGVLAEDRECRRGQSTIGTGLALSSRTHFGTARVPALYAITAGLPTGSRFVAASVSAEDLIDAGASLT